MLLLLAFLSRTAGYPFAGSATQFENHLGTVFLVAKLASIFSEDVLFHAGSAMLTGNH